MLSNFLPNFSLSFKNAHVWALAYKCPLCSPRKRVGRMDACFDYHKSSEFDFSFFLEFSGNVWLMFAVLDF